MQDTAERTWTALNGCLVFEFKINRDPNFGDATTATIWCKPGSSEAREVIIYENLQSVFDVKFRSGCYAHGYLQQRRHVQIEGVDSIGVFADIRFGKIGRFEEVRFEGLMVACPSIPQPVPPPPLPPIPPDVDPIPAEWPLPAVEPALDELFPYVYMRRWPAAANKAFAYAFISYAPTSPPDAFMDDLAAAKLKGRRDAEALALAFIDGAAPYSGQFVARLADLQGPVRTFAALGAQLRPNASGADDWLELLCAELNLILALEQYTADYFTSPAYQAQIERVWNSYVALAVQLDYDQALLCELALTLWVQHAIALGTQAATGDELQPQTLSPSQRADLGAAQVLMPPAIFPLPPAAGGGGSPPELTGWIEPYAIGDLQMARQRLKGYAPGEIARIENIMRGERRETSSRRLRRHEEQQSFDSREAQQLQTDDADQGSSLLEEARKTIAERSVSNNYDNFQSSYGPPTQATLNGSWTRQVKSGLPGADDTTRFAREVLSKTVSRITRKVGSLRTTTTLSQTEELVSSVIDNAAGGSDIRAVFRWLNKVYEARVVNYGARLMMEFAICRPAAAYLADETALEDVRLAKPLPPSDLGVDTFEDITRNNYARLCAYYGVTELQPPPPESKLAALSLRASEEKQTPIPSGYWAVSATVACAEPSASAPTVLVGGKPAAVGAVTDLAPYGEAASLPVSASAIPPSLSPPSDGDVLLNIELSCAPTPSAMDEWRIGIYGVIVRAYREEIERYRAATRVAAPVARRSPLAYRRIEQQALRAACDALLMQRRATLTGESLQPSSPPTPADVNAPRYIQFLDAALEWPEMTYSFHASASAGDADADDELFARFLQADQARVLVPVRPSKSAAFLYFFSAGLIWNAPDGLVGVQEEDAPLIYDLDVARRRDGQQASVGAAWEVVVPTAMQILDSTAQLPLALPAPDLAEGSA